MPLTFLIVKAQGRGKTSFVVKKLRQFSGRRNFIYDPRGGFSKYPDIKNKAKLITTKKEFFKIVPLDYPSFANVVYPDASSLIPSTGDLPDDVADQISTVFHTKNMNFWELHGLDLLNMKMLDFIDYLVLGRTTGDPGAVLRKFKNYPKIIAGYKYIQKVTAGTAYDRDKNKFLPGEYKDEETGEIIYRTAAYSKEWYHKHVVIKISE